MLMYKINCSMPAVNLDSAANSTGFEIPYYFNDIHIGNELPRSHPTFFLL